MDKHLDSCESSKSQNLSVLAIWLTEVYRLREKPVTFFFFFFFLGGNFQPFLVIP